MTENGNRRNLAFMIPAFVLVCLFFFLAGCAGLKTAENPETALRERVQTYWQYKVNKEFAEAYLMETPEVRKETGLSDYVMAMGGGVIWLGVTVDSVSIQGDFAEARVNLRYGVFGMYSPKEGITRPIMDCWELVDGEWYHMLACPRKKKRARSK